MTIVNRFNCGGLLCLIGFHSFEKTRCIYITILLLYSGFFSFTLSTFHDI